ncbi:MAG: HAMP domain-containing histidine kinase [Cyanothece sp. SIO1E1]|nr:HAMP domain-containing histidine kinase [Cyanothece sp. SIO1E1]
MGWINLLFLLVGIGVGIVGSRFYQRPQSKNDSEPSILMQELQQTLKQTQLAHHMAVEMGQFQAGFLARTSHELRSPLSSTLSLHQLILSDLCEGPAEEREFVTQAYYSAQKMLGLLDELTNVSKVEAGRIPLQIQPIQLLQIFEEVHQLTHLQAANRNLQFNMIAPEPELYVLADSRWLRQILVSLISTAMSLMETGSLQLLINPSSSSDYVDIWIEDQRPADAWQESIDLLQQPTHSDQLPELTLKSQKSLAATLKDDLDSKLRPSAGLSLLANKSLMEAMQGRLEILATPATETSLTRTQCSIRRGKLSA